MYYYEMAYGSVKNRNKIKTLEEIQVYRQKAIEDNEEMFISTYRYDEQLLEHLKIRNSVKGYIGNQWIDKLIFDFDKGVMSDNQLQFIVQEFIKEFIEEWKLPKDAINLYFSGRGFHLTTPDFFGFKPSSKLPEIVKATIVRYFPNIDYSVYDPASLIRVANTINAKVRRYKIPITVEELYHLTMDEILKLSEVNRRIMLPTVDPLEIPLYPEKIVYPTPEMKVQETEGNYTNRVTCMQKLYKRGPIQGKRHQEMMRLASSWRRGSVTEDAINILLSNWDPTFDKAEIAKIVRNTFDANNYNGYNFSCNDEVMKAHCDERCIFWKNKDYGTDLLSHTDMENNFVKFIRSDYQTKSLDLMKLLKVPNKSHLIIPGENVLFFGDSGIGKTGVAQNMAINANHVKVLYGNFEFTTNLLYRRFVQIKNEMTKQDVIKYYQINDNSMSKGLEHIKIVDNTIDLKGLYQIMDSYEPNFVILDTLFKIRTADKNDYAKGVTLSNAFKKIAKDYNTIVMAINHIPKTVKKGKLNQHSGKGAGDLENMSDHVLIIEGKADSDNRIIHAGKARDEAKFNLPFIYNWNTFTFQYVGK